MRNTMCLAAVLLLFGTSTYAQSDSPLRPGAVRLLGSTSASFARQTLSAEGEPGDNVNTTALSAGLLYFPKGNVGVGLLTNFQKLSMPVADADDVEMSTTAVGPEVQFRFPITARSAFFVAGSGGYSKLSLTGGAAEGGEASAAAGDTTGIFFGGGAGVEAFLTDSVALNVELLYQKSKLTQGESKFDSSGFTVAFGLAVYLGGQ